MKMSLKCVKIISLLSTNVFCLWLDNSCTTKRKTLLLNTSVRSPRVLSWHPAHLQYAVSKDGAAHTCLWTDRLYFISLYSKTSLVIQLFFTMNMLESGCPRPIVCYKSSWVTLSKTSLERKYPCTPYGGVLTSKNILMRQHIIISYLKQRNTV